jgi:hypothetical protein
VITRKTRHLTVFTGRSIAALAMCVGVILILAEVSPSLGWILAVFGGALLADHVASRRAVHSRRARS